MSEILKPHKSKIALDRWLETRQNHLMESENGLKKVFCLVKDKNEVERYVFILYRETNLGFKIVDIYWMFYSYNHLASQQNWQRSYNFKLNSNIFVPGKFKKVNKMFVEHFKNIISSLELPKELLKKRFSLTPGAVLEWNKALSGLIYPNNFNYNNSSNSLLSS